MLTFALTGLVAVFVSGFWSRLRWGFFDLFCFLCAFAGGLLVPPLLERFFPMLIEVGGVEGDFAGALIGCAIYDATSWGFR